MNTEFQNTAQVARIDDPQTASLTAPVFFGVNSDHNRRVSGGGLSGPSDRFPVLQLAGGGLQHNNTRPAGRTTGTSAGHFNAHTMKSSSNRSFVQSRRLFGFEGLAVVAALGAAVSVSQGAESTNAAPAQAEKPAPLPLHQIEGNGGIFATLSAYIVNPPRNGEVVGRPSVGFTYVNVGHGRNLEALTVTESPHKRVELGYGFNHFELGDLPAVIAAGGGHINDSVNLHNFNLRGQILKEGEFDQKWAPAFTTGAHFKHNDGISTINDQLANTLHNIGITDNDGVDFTFYASKLVTGLPRPVLFNLGGRATKGAWNGLAGFTENYSVVAEGNVVVFVTDRLALAAEYKQQPGDFSPIGLVKRPGDWWTIDAAYVVNKHFTVAAGYGHFGGVLNHEANGVWGVTTKFEF